MQLVEGVEEAFLGLFLAADKVDVVDEQHAQVPVFAAELLGLPLPYGGDKLVGKLLGADAEHCHVPGQGHLPDGVQKVGLPQPRPAVDKERVIAQPRLLGNCLRRGKGQPVALAHHE